MEEFLYYEKRLAFKILQIVNALDNNSWTVYILIFREAFSNLLPYAFIRL